MNLNNFNLAEFVGQYVKFGNVYGMIDAVHGERIGLVWASNKNGSWTAEIVEPQDVSICTNEHERALAHESALLYFKNEVENMRHRLLMAYPCDNRATIEKLLTYSENWLKKISITH